MLVYTVVFSVLLKAFTIEHYPLFILSGLVTWVFFQSAVQMSASSLHGQPTLVKQVRFPRHFLPFAVVAANIVTLATMFLAVLIVNLDRDPGDANDVLGGDPAAPPAHRARERPRARRRLR